MKQAAADWMEHIRSYNANIRKFMLANILLQTGLGVFMVMYNLYIKELGMPETVNGSVVSMSALATAIMLIPAGFMSDRFGRRPMLLIGSLLAAVMLFIRSFTALEQPIVWAAFASGIFMALSQVSGVPFLAENSAPAERVKLFSIHFALMTVSNVVGSLIGGVLSDALEWGFGLSAVSAIRASLFAGSAVFAAGAVPLFFLEKVKRIKPVKTDVLTPVQRAAQQFDRRFWRNIGIIALFGFSNLLVGTGSGLVVPYLNLYFANRFHSSNGYIGFILSLGSAMTAVAMLIGPMLVKRLGKVRAVVVFQLASLPFLLITAFTTSLAAASLGFLLRQALMNAGNPVQSAIAMEIVEDKYKGLANSVNQMVFNLGWASMAPVAAGLVTAYGSYWGYAYAFSITSGLYLVASVYFYAVFGRRKAAL